MYGWLRWGVCATQASAMLAIRGAMMKFRETSSSRWLHLAVTRYLQRMLVLPIGSHSVVACGFELSLRVFTARRWLEVACE
jgi:hypothetical protein